MATRGPRGRMTKPMSTFYNVGDHVMLVRDLEFTDGLAPRPELGPAVGDVGTIRRITISDPNDGDDTVLLFAIEWEGGPYPELEGGLSVGADVLIPWPKKPARIPRRSLKVRRESEAWLRGQLATLGS